MSIRIAISLAAVMAAAGACSQPPPKGEYKLPLKEAFSRLENADLTGFRNHRQCGLLIHINASHPDDHSINWDVTSDGYDVASFKVSLHPSGNATKATIIIPKESAGGEMYDSKVRYRHPGLRQPLRPALQELVDSAMEQRSFDFNRIEGELSVDGVCNSEHDRLASGRATFRIDDPKHMSHEEVLNRQATE